MVWQRVKEGRGGYRQEDVKHASPGKEKKKEVASLSMFDSINFGT